MRLTSKITYPLRLALLVLCLLRLLCPLLRVRRLRLIRGQGQVGGTGGSGGGVVSVASPCDNVWFMILTNLRRLPRVPSISAKLLNRCDNIVQERLRF